MIGELQQSLLELELDILALEVELRLRVVRALPLAPFTSPSIARSHLWLLGYIPSVLPTISAMFKDMDNGSGGWELPLPPKQSPQSSMSVAHR